MSTNNSQQPPSGSGKTCRCASKMSLIVWIAVLLVIVVVLYVRFTPSGQEMMGNIANHIANEGFVNGLRNWLLGEGNVQAENEAAAELEKCGVIVIKERDKGVTSIDFSNCPKPTDEALKLITKLRHLNSVNFSNAEIIDDQLAYLAKMNHLSNVLISGTLITDAGLVYLVDSPAIQTLHASHTKITDKGMEQIAKLPMLTILNISGTGITDKGIKQIAQLPELNWLLIQSTNVTDAGLAELASLPMLRRLTISKDMKISKEAIQKLLKVFPKLQVDIYAPEPPAAKPPSDVPLAAGTEKDEAKASGENKPGDQ
ncbi:MAG: hypothetical protein ABSA77_04295 [Thermoguttaceae bacterium]|jgi:hypothetical protein